MLLKITAASYWGNYRVRLVFNDGRAGEADLRALADTNPESLFFVFSDEVFARQFDLQHGTLCWPGDRDVAAEYLYFLAFHDDPALQPLFRQWGYLGQDKAVLAA